MANISLQTRVSAKTRPEIDIMDATFRQTMTLPAAEAITAGAPVRLVPSSTGAGRWTNAKATAYDEADAWGLATRTAVAGETITAVRRGIVDGLDVSSLDYGAIVFLSDTDGRVADAHGTLIRPIGRVIPATAVPLGTAYDRLLELDFSMPERVFYVPHTALLVADQIDQTVFLATRACQLIGASEVHKTAESGGTLHIQLTRQQSTEAPASGDALLTNNTNAGFDGTGTAETVQAGTLISTVATKQFAVGDRLGWDYTGDTAGELAGVHITAAFMPL